MSQIFINGFVGVSIQRRSNWPARSVKSRGSVASRKVNSTPYSASIFVKKRWVPP